MTKEGRRRPRLGSRATRGNKHYVGNKKSRARSRGTMCESVRTMSPCANPCESVRIVATPDVLEPSGIIFDQGAAGAPTQKTTQLLCSPNIHSAVLARFGPLTSAPKPNDPSLLGPPD